MEIDWVNTASITLAAASVWYAAVQHSSARRKWEPGSIDVASARTDFMNMKADDGSILEHDEWVNLRLMNVGMTPVRLRHVFLHDMKPRLDMLPDPLSVQVMLAQGESTVIPVSVDGNEPWILVMYFDHSDKRFIFLQFINLYDVETDDDLRWPYGSFLDWIRVRDSSKPRTIRPQVSTDMTQELDHHQGLLRIRRGARWSPRHLESLVRSIRSASLKGIDLTQWQLRSIRRQD